MNQSKGNIVAKMPGSPSLQPKDRWIYVDVAKDKKHLLKAMRYPSAGTPNYGRDKDRRPLSDHAIDCIGNLSKYSRSLVARFYRTGNISCESLTATQYQRLPLDQKAKRLKAFAPGVLYAPDDIQSIATLSLIHI